MSDTRAGLAETGTGAYDSAHGSMPHQYMNDMKDLHDMEDISVV